MLGLVNVTEIKSKIKLQLTNFQQIISSQAALSSGVAACM